MTFEEISKYPPGTKFYLGTKIQEEHGCWLTEDDKKIVNNKHSWFNIEFYPNNLYKGHYLIAIEYTVEGWLYNGEEWEIVENSWDGWVPVKDFEEILYKAERAKLKE